MPFAGEEQEHTAPRQRDAVGEGGAAEPALALGDVEELVFLQHAAALLGEEVAGRVARGGIGLPGGDGLRADGMDGKPPEAVALVGDEVFQVDVFLAHSCLTWLGG